ncbi:DUF4435 domain-containing protein [Vibrio sp. 10N.286.51.F4]|uniref:DUF4435 domain-containing protein n=1 Tax=Vibrio sp. 10N.286.51.F4 TaxID=3229710 RepID=UPI0035517E50
MASFIDYLTDKDFIKAYLLMNGHAGKCGFLFIENEKDKAFWSTFLGQNLVSKYVFSASHNLGTIQCGARGKARFDSLLPKASDVAIFAIDADIDHLTPSRFDKCNEIINNPHVLHTYGYSKESISNCSAVLDDCLSKFTYFSESPYKFEAFLINYSQIIYPALLKFLYLLNNHEDFNEESEFNQIIIPQENHLYSMFFDNDYSQFTAVITQYISELDAIINDADVTLNEVAYQYFGLTDTTAYQFINGHNLEERIVDKIVNQIKCRLIKDEFEKYKNEGATGQLLGDRHKELTNHFNENVKFSTLRCHSSAFVDDLVYKQALTQLANI